MAHPPTHQTITLGRGRHSGPRQGACVMELASMLAGEPFSDHPRCVSPTAAAFLRAYNDGIPFSLRQDLRRFASEAVGTRGSDRAEIARGLLCRAWVREQVSAAPRGWRGWSLRVAGHLPRETDPEWSAGIAARVALVRVRVKGDMAHAQALAFVERLLSTGEARRRGRRVPSRASACTSTDSAPAARYAGG